VAPLLSDEHFSVDGTLIEAWASMKSLQPKAPPDGSGGGGGAEEKSPARPASRETEPSTTTETTPMTTTTKTRKDRNAEVDFRGSKRSNETHRSVTDPQARLYRKGKGKPAQLCFMGHALMENRSGLIVEAELTQADGHAERAAAIAMIERHSPGSERRLTLGADKGYDSTDFVAELRRMCVTPHVAAKARSSAIDGRTTRHAGYAVSQRKRKRIEEPFGWGKTVGQLRKTMLRGLARVGAQFALNMAAYNLARLPRLLAA
jgi:DDE family transposase